MWTGGTPLFAGVFLCRVIFLSVTTRCVCVLGLYLFYMRFLLIGGVVRLDGVLMTDDGWCSTNLTTTGLVVGGWLLLL